MRAIGWLWLLLGLFELWLLIRVGAQIGALPTVLLVVLTAITGLTLLRHQGWQLLRQADSRLRGGEPPTRELLEAMLLAFGALLLLIPGFASDLLGLVCVLPPSRRAVAAALLRRLGGGRRPPPGGPGGPGGSGGSGPTRRPPVTLEGDFRREDP